MEVSDIILCAISEIAIERKISEENVTWHMIAIKLATKIKQNE